MPSHRPFDILLLSEGRNIKSQKWITNSGSSKISMVSRYPFVVRIRLTPSGLAHIWIDFPISSHVTGYDLYPDKLYSFIGHAFTLTLSYRTQTRCSLVSGLENNSSLDRFVLHFQRQMINIIRIEIGVNYPDRESLYLEKSYLVKCERSLNARPLGLCMKEKSAGGPILEDVLKLMNHYCKVFSLSY